jgi:NDP-sugar pyrophosphorylase family protein
MQVFILAGGLGTVRLAAEGQVMAYRHGGFFVAMHTYWEYKYLNELWNNGEILGRCGNERGSKKGRSVYFWGLLHQVAK